MKMIVNSTYQLAAWDDGWFKKKKTSFVDSLFPFRPKELKMGSF